MYKRQGIPADKVQEAFKKLLGKLGVVRDLFRGFDYSAYAVSYTHLTLPTSDLV